jgi:hypothetical protein
MSWRNDKRRLDRVIRHGAVSMVLRGDQVHMRLNRRSRCDGRALCHGRVVTVGKGRMMKRRRSMMRRIRWGRAVRHGSVLGSNVMRRLVMRRVMMIGGRLLVSV